MEVNEIVRRLEKIAPYGTHYPGEPLFVLSLDDGIALKEAIELLKKQKPQEVTEAPDRETVIKGLESVSYYFKSLLAVGWQGDADIYKEHREKIRMAITLLKEQEPVKPKEYMSRVNRTEYLCGACDSGILYGDEFCRHCGRQVKWDAANPNR